MWNWKWRPILHGTKKMWAAVALCQVQVKDLREIPYFCSFSWVSVLCPLNSMPQRTAVPWVQSQNEDNWSRSELRLQPGTKPSKAQLSPAECYLTHRPMNKKWMCYKLLRSWVCLLLQYKLTNTYIKMHYFMFILFSPLDFKHSCTICWK